MEQDLPLLVRSLDDCGPKNIGQRASASWMVILTRFTLEDHHLRNRAIPENVQF